MQFELKEGDEVVATAKNAADSVTFEDQKYAAVRQPHTISEKQVWSRCDTTTLLNMVTVNVTDNGQVNIAAVTGTILPSQTLMLKSLTQVIFSAKKVLKGDKKACKKVNLSLNLKRRWQSRWDNYKRCRRYCYFQSY